MKCEKCGKNEVAFLYRGNINGNVTERHLCRACAEKEGYLRRMHDQSRRLLDTMLEDADFCGLWDGLLPDIRALSKHLFDEELLDDFFLRMPALGVSENCAETAPPLLDSDARERYARLRERNELECALKDAVASERYEDAARLRDQLKARQ